MTIVMRSELPDILRRIVVENEPFRLDDEGWVTAFSDHFVYAGTKDAEGRPEWCRYLRRQMPCDDPEDDPFDGTLESLEKCLQNYDIQILDEPDPRRKFGSRTYEPVPGGDVARDIPGKRICGTEKATVQGADGDESILYVYFDDGTYCSFVQPDDDD